MKPVQIISGRFPVVHAMALARGIHRLAFHAPLLAERILPGQFVMLRIPDRTDPLLGRAFALYDVLHENDRPSSVEIVYQVVGKMTGFMTTLRPGDEVEVFGPLGQPFPSYSGYATLVCVAGGIGQTPFLSLIKRVLGVAAYGGNSENRECSLALLLYGARSADLFAGLEDFAATGAEVLLATDDGSAGRQGRVTDLLRQWVDEGKIVGPAPWVGCGPEPMLKALAQLAEEVAAPCDLSLETPMACGAGICYSCVTKVRTADGWDYRRVCVEGPIFRSSELILE